MWKMPRNIDFSCLNRSIVSSIQYQDYSRASTVHPSNIGAGYRTRREAHPNMN